jgi:hypothetical protein
MNDYNGLQLLCREINLVWCFNPIQQQCRFSGNRFGDATSSSSSFKANCIPVCGYITVYQEDIQDQVTERYARPNRINSSIAYNGRVHNNRQGNNPKNHANDSCRTPLHAQCSENCAVDAKDELYYNKNAHFWPDLQASLTFMNRRQSQ